MQTSLLARLIHADHQSSVHTTSIWSLFFNLLPKHRSQLTYKPACLWDVGGNRRKPAITESTQRKPALTERTCKFHTNCILGHNQTWVFGAEAADQSAVPLCCPCLWKVFSQYREIISESIWDWWKNVSINPSNILCDLVFLSACSSGPSHSFCGGDSRPAALAVPAIYILSWPLMLQCGVCLNFELFLTRCALLKVNWTVQNCPLYNGGKWEFIRQILRFVWDYCKHMLMFQWPKALFLWPRKVLQ